MKKVIMIFSTDENIAAIQHLHNHLKNIFEENIEIQDIFLDRLSKDEPLEADAYLILSEDILQLLKNNISDYSKILVVRRSINKKFLSAVTEIPDGETVLVVNDSVVSSLQTVYNLYELGFSNLNLVPFNETKPASLYDGYTTAITPNEEHLVPEDVKHIINIGYRDISFDTLLRLTQLLELENNRTYKNLILSMKTVTDSSSFLYTKYLQDFLKVQALSHTVTDANQAVILCSVDNQIIYTNSKANDLFGSHLSSLNIDSLTELSPMREGDYMQAEIEIRGKLYSANKAPIKLMAENIGFSYTFQPYKKNPGIKRNGMFAKYTFSDIIHHSKKMDDLIAMAKDIAKTDYTVSITGESGTGKEMLAQSIHNYSSRKNRPFVAINCAALTDSLLDSELFGYEKGAFTGADSRGKSGLFEQAHGGTIFLDEIGDISPHMQLRLLRTLQEKQIMKIGGTRLIDIDVRVIAATNKNLEDEVLKGNFRDDLFYRLNVIPIHVPPLRERKEDVLPLFSFFVTEKFSDLTEAEKDMLMACSWPGNVRQLENVATYYNALSRLPNLESTSLTGSASLCGHTAFDFENVKFQVLDIICQHTQLSHGAGQIVVLQHLRERGINIGDKNLRLLLKQLNDDGLITICKGRTGMRITSLGYLTLGKQRL